MCMICLGIKKGKFSHEDAVKKYEEFLDLDLLDEDHQEEVEALLAEVEGDEYYWKSAKQDYYRSKDYYKDDDSYDDNSFNENIDDEEYDN